MQKKKEGKKRTSSKQINPDVKKEIKDQVAKQVEKEVDYVQEDIAGDVSKDIDEVLKKRFDIIDRFHGLEYHNKFLFALIVGFGVVAFWRGLWLLMDEIVFPGFPILSGAFTTLLGLTILAASGALMKVFD